MKFKQNIIAIILISFFIINTYLLHAVTIDKNQGTVSSNIEIFKDPVSTSQTIGTISKNETFIALEIRQDITTKDVFVHIKNDKINGWIPRYYALLNINSEFNNFKFKQLNINKLNLDLPYNYTIWVALSDYDKEFKRYYYYLIASNKTTSLKLVNFPDSLDFKYINFIDVNDDNQNELIIETPMTCETDPSIWSTLEIYKFNPTSIEELFKIQTTNSSHEFDIYLNNVNICNKKIETKNLCFGKAEYHKDGRVTFGTFWTLPVYLKTKNYQWDMTTQKYIHSVGTNTPIYCKNTVNTLRLREQPNLNSKILKGITLNEKLEVLEITNAYPVEMQEIKPGAWGFWVKVKDSNNTIGWAFSYYLDFEEIFLNSYFKFTNTKKPTDDDFINMPLVNVQVD